MARLPRLVIDGQVHHLVHRAAADLPVFGQNADREEFLAALLEVSRPAGIALHAYALLPDRVDLLFTPQSGAEVAPMMQRLGRRFVAAFNRRHDSTGSPWAGRYGTSVLQASRYLLEAMRLVEVRPQALGLVNRVDEWTSSSVSHHLGLRSDPLVTDHPIYWALGNTPFERQLAYRQLLDSTPANRAVTDHIDAATGKGWALGDAAFIEQLSARQARRLQPFQRGRPKRD